MALFYSKTKDNIHRRFRSIDEFDVINEIGKGGYSVVYLAKHIKSGKKYALKCAFKEKKGKDRSPRIRQEIEVLSRMKHNNIIKLSGWFEDNDTIYLVLQYISGRDLSKYFKRDLPDKHNIAKIMLQIIDALQYCHSNHIIHRDMKLENILIDSNMNIKLTDFGLCAIKDKNFIHLKDAVGTARYTSPELLQGDGYNESVDVWGLGVIFFMLLTGNYPFDGSKRKSIFRRIKHKNINYDYYDLDKYDIHLLKRLLCKDPNLRIRLDDIPKHKWFKKLKVFDPETEETSSSDSSSSSSASGYKSHHRSGHKSHHKSHHRSGDSLEFPQNSLYYNYKYKY